MKQIKTCPISKDKCENRTNRSLVESGCSIYSDINLCTKCTRFRKKQGRHSIMQVKKYKVYRSAGCKL